MDVERRFNMASDQDGPPEDGEVEVVDATAAAGTAAPAPLPLLPPPVLPPKLVAVGPSRDDLPITGPLTPQQQWRQGRRDVATNWGRAVAAAVAAAARDGGTANGGNMLRKLVVIPLVG